MAARGPRRRGVRTNVGSYRARLASLVELPAAALPNLQSPRGIAKLLVHVVGGRPLAELARAVGADRATLGRWLRGDTEPKLPDFLGLLDVTTRRLLSIISTLVDPETLPEARAVWRTLQAQQDLAYEHPMSHAVLRALELSSYKKARAPTAGLIGERVGLNASEVEHLLEALAAAGQIRVRAGRWHTNEVMTVDTGNHEARNRQLKHHWAKVASERIDATLDAGDGFVSYNLFAVSEAGFEEVKKLHAEYYERIRDVIAHDRDPERVVLSNLYLVPLDS